MSIKLGSAFLGPEMFVSIFFLDSLTTLEDRPVCQNYQWVAHPTYGSVCNHCARMMDGFTIDDLISRSGTGFLNRRECRGVCSWRRPHQLDWDDWPLRMTFRIHFFLLANRDNPEPDLAILNAL